MTQQRSVEVQYCRANPNPYTSVGNSVGFSTGGAIYVRWSTLHAFNSSRVLFDTRLTVAR